MSLGSDYISDNAYEINQALIRYEQYVEAKNKSRKSDTEFKKLCRSVRQKLETEQRKTK